MIMKKAKYSFACIFFCFMLLASCEKDYQNSAVVDVNTPVSFSKEVVPILIEDCATINCHVSGAQSPDLSAVSAYDQLTGLGYIDTTNAAGSILYQRITATTKPMPPSGKLNAQEIAFILAWIKQGAQNN